MTNQLKHLAAVTIATIAMGSTAVAGSVNFDYRFDYKNTTYNSDHTSAALSGKSDFLAQTGRLDFKGKFSDDVSYRLRYRLNLWTAAATNTRNDSLAANVDLMYLTQKMNDTVTLTLGKFTSDLGGYDGTQSGADIYLASQNWATIWSGNGYFGAKPFVSGVKGTFGLDGHELNVFVANSQEGSAANASFTAPSTYTAAKSGAPSAQTRMTTGVTFKGSLMDKALTPYVSYASEKANIGTNSSAYDMDTKYTYMTIGLKYDTSDWFAALDNSTFTASKITGNGDWAQGSMVLNAGYMMDKMTYKLMYDTSSGTLTPSSGTATKTTVTGTSLAAEYRPTTDKNFRYHVAYTTQSSKTDTGTTTSTETNLIAGVRLNADFLK